MRFSAIHSRLSSASKHTLLLVLAGLGLGTAAHGQASPVVQSFGATPTSDANYPFSNSATSGGTGSATLAANITSSGTFEIGYFTDVPPPTGSGLQAPKGTGAFGIFNNNNGNTVYTTQLDFAEKIFHINSGTGSTTATRNRLSFSLASVLPT